MKESSFMFLRNAFDSHVHWLATGLRNSALSLKHLTSPRDALVLPTEPNRGEWTLGHGWDNNLWAKQELPTAKDLAHFPGPVVFRRVDGHALWANEEALARAGVKNSNGVLIDAEMNPVMDLIPKPSHQDNLNGLRAATKHFNKQGFTHIRDLSCSTEQWEAATQLEESGELTLAVEQYFDSLPYRKFDAAFAEAKYCRKQKSRLLRVKGIKVFFDGALGSEGALMHCCYPGGSHGLQLLNYDELTTVATQVWAEGLRLAIHMIGDAAAEKVIDHLLALKDKGVTGGLDFEHCQVMTPESIMKLRGLDVTIHMQPCHWLSDKRWLRTKLPDINAEIFPWSQIEEMGKKIYFGSDSPIEPASVLLNQQAIEDAAKQKIRPPKFGAAHYQSHPDHDWVPNCQTEFVGPSVGQTAREIIRTTFDSVLVSE